MSHKLNLHDGTGIAIEDPGLGILLAYGSTVPAATTVGYAPGCHFMKTNGTSVGSVAYMNVGTKASANFQLMGLGGAYAVSFNYGEATPLDAAMFVVNRASTVLSIIARPLVVGSDVGAVTAEIRKAPSGTASASGTILHSGTIDLKGTINTNQTLTLTTTSLANGDAVCLDVTGTTTDARGVITVVLIPA